MSNSELDTLKEGWGWPGASRKAHYFAEGESISLCRRWMYTGNRTSAHDTNKGRDDCAACSRLLVKREGQ